MRYIMTFIWSFALVTVLNYVVGSIANVAFDFEKGIIVTLVLGVLIILLGEALPEEPVSDH